MSDLKISILKKKNNCNCAEILIVDDEIFNIICIEKMLKEFKIKTDRAINGQ
jgi:PleD family two-component response regulator